jgi:hypothetical protein
MTLVDINNHSLREKMNVQDQPSTLSRTAVVVFESSSGKDSKFKSLFNRSYKSVKNHILNFNIFNNRTPLNVTSHELRNGIHSTRIFILLLFNIITAFVLSSALLPEFKTVTVEHINKNEYEKLKEKYSETLRCPCKKISIEYAEFSLMEPTFHPICSSMYIIDQWFLKHLPFLGINPLIVLPTMYKDSRNFRIAGPSQFRILSLFCKLSNRTVYNNLAVLNKTALISSHVLSLSSFESQTNAFIDRFISSTVNTFLGTIDIIATVTQPDEFSLNLDPLHNWWYDDDYMNYSSPFWSSCYPCKIKRNCLHEVVLYSPNIIPTSGSYVQWMQSSHVILGWYGGCSVLSSLMFSNFQCFFSEECVTNIEAYIHKFDWVAHDYIPADNRYPQPAKLVYIALNSSILNQSTINSTIKQIIRQLMVESWNPKVFYSKYFSACEPTSCTYAYMGRSALLHVLSLIIGLVGGLTTILKLVIPPIVKFFRRNKTSPQLSQDTHHHHHHRRRRQTKRRTVCHSLWKHRSRP